MVFVVAGSNTLAALNLSNGQIAWHRALGDPAAASFVVSSPAAAEGRLFVGAGALYALNARTGDTVWSYAPGAGSGPRPPSRRTAGPPSGAWCTPSRREGALRLLRLREDTARGGHLVPRPGPGLPGGEGILFDGRASYDPDGDITAWNWSLGEGNFSTEPSFTRSYDQPGEYNISLAVRDDKGLEGRTFVEIKVRNNTAPGSRRRRSTRWRAT